MENETTPEEKQEVSSLETEQTPAEVSEDVKTPEEASIPYSRFKEVIEEKNEFKTKLEELSKTVESLKKPAEEPEPETWQEVEKRAIEKATAKIREELSAKDQAKLAEEKEIEREFTQLKKLDSNISHKVENIILETMIKTGNKSVIDTYLEIKDKVSKAENAKQQKSEAFIPPSQKGSEATPTFTYKSIQGKSLMDIIREES